MAFSFYSPPILNPEQSGAMPDILGKILSGYTQSTQARYLQPTLEEALQKAKLFNQYYGPNIESEMALRRAQTGEAGARTGLIGEQTKGAHIANQYMPQTMEAQIAQLNAQAQQAKLLQMIREQMMGGGVPQQGKSAQGGPQMQPFQGQGMPAMEGQGGQSGQIPQPQQGMDYGKAATIMQMLGLGKPQVVNANGKYMAITPFGNIDTGVAGLSGRDAQLAKEDAKKIAHLEDIVQSGSQKQETFNALNEDLGSKEFEAMRQHPNLGSKELWWYEKNGTPEQKEMIGRIRTHMGNIIKDSSRDFAGQFRVGEQALLNSMKPNESDSLQTMKGKAEALTFMNQVITQRSEMEADLMRNQNVSFLQAKLIADKAIDPKKVKEEVRTILHPASNTKGNYSQSDLEFTARKHGMTVDEVRQKLGSR